MPSKRIAPTKKIDNEINELLYKLDEKDNPKDFLGKLMKLAMKRIVQEILEGEVQDFTGRDYYKHGENSLGHRNGYESSTLKTAEGHLDIERPQVRDGQVPFESKVWRISKSTLNNLNIMPSRCMFAAARLAT